MSEREREREEMMLIMGKRMAEAIYRSKLAPSAEIAIWLMWVETINLYGHSSLLLLDYRPEGPSLTTGAPIRDVSPPFWKRETMDTVRLS